MEIKSVSFHVLSPEEIRKQSVVPILETAIYHKNLPKAFGVCDHRMGTGDRKMACGTCGGTLETCNGHPGHLELPLPCYGAFFLMYALKILRSVCFFCSRLLVLPFTQDPETQVRKPTKLGVLLQTCSGQDLFAGVYKLAKTKKECPHCGMLQPSYAKHVAGKTFGISVTWDDKALAQWDSENPDHVLEKQWALKPFTAREALNILDRISNEDASYLGLDPEFVHPRQFMLTVLHVAPPVIRPSVVASEGSKSRGQNDLTRKLLDIVKAVQALKDIPDKDTILDQLRQGDTLPPVLEKHWTELQYHVATFHNNEIRGLKQATTRAGVPLKGIHERVKGKNGRIRGNVMGKRVDFSSRTVVSPDPNLALDEVGVPLRIALTLTLEEKVTPFNIESLQRKVFLGAKIRGGAHTVIKDDGTMIYLSFLSPDLRSRFILQYGWTVERYLENGDYVLFNRQPSLHKKSLMAHKVVILPYDTFRLNLSVCPAYNCDFDGDEMNLHAINDLEARAELSELLAVSKNMLNAQTNKPTYGLVQDALVGSFLMTCKDIFFARESVMNLLTSISVFELPEPAVVKPKALWTGKQVYSCLFPDFLHLTKRTQNADNDPILEDSFEKIVVIRQGVLLAGRLSKETVGASTNGLVHQIIKDGSMDLACSFLTRAQFLVNHFLASYGFSVGISDCVPKPEVTEQVRVVIADSYRKIQKVNDLVSIGRIPKEDAEEPVTNVLRHVIKDTGTVAIRHMDPKNRIGIMAAAGSKGSSINLSQIMACVGQQTVDGRRLHTKHSLTKKVTWSSRTLSCFSPEEEHPESHGFVKCSYSSGLDPIAFFQCAQGGREGLVDTAVKTSVTGYIQRKLMKGMEAHKVDAFGSVRDAQAGLISPLYGGDGIDAQFLEPVSVSFLSLDVESLKRQFLPWEFKRFKAYFEKARWLKTSPFSQTDFPESCLLPVHVQRMSETLPRTPTRVSSEAYFSRVSETIEFFRKKPGTFYLRLCLCYYFRTRVLVAKRVSLEDLDQILERIKNGYAKCRVDAGEMVGALASESIGEPSTQLTLNTFHVAGVGSKNVILGIPRLKELLDVTKNAKTPSLTIYLAPVLSQNEAQARALANSLIHTTLKDVIQNMDTEHEPDPRVSETDPMLLHDHFAFRNFLLLQGASSWVIRITLNRDLCRARNLTPFDITSSLREYVGSRAEILYSADEAPVWILRITFFDLHRMMQPLLEHGKESEALELEKVLVQTQMQRLLHLTVLGGIPGIKGASVRKIHFAHVPKDPQEPVTQRHEFVIDTQGTSLREVFAMDHMDWSRSISNDLWEVCELLGLEAAAQILFHEIKTVLSFDGSYVNDRHIALVVDTMTYCGKLMPMSRHGINRVGNYSVLTRASFEESFEILTAAAVFHETDSLKGVTENVMMGTRAPIGTGNVSLVIPKEYQKRIQRERYGKVVQEKRQERILKSVITQVSGPENAPGLLHLCFPKRDQRLVSEAPSEFEFPLDLSLGSSLSTGFSIGSRKRYRPSSPDLTSPKNLKKGKVSNSMFRPFALPFGPLPVKKPYRPSSPDLCSVSGPVSHVTASDIPLGTGLSSTATGPLLQGSQMSDFMGSLSKTLFPNITKNG